MTEHRHGKTPFGGPKYQGTDTAIRWGDEVAYGGFNPALNIPGYWQVIGFDCAAGKVQVRHLEQPGRVHLVGAAALVLKARAVTACPECQWQATTRAAGELLEKYGFKPKPAALATEQEENWDALEGRR